MSARNPFSDLASAMAVEARASIAAARLADAERPVGTLALRLGVSDYRKPPEVSIHSDDWAVWRVKWDGREWCRNKRLSSGKTFEEALRSISRLSEDLGLPRVD